MAPPLSSAQEKALNQLIKDKHYVGRDALFKLVNEKYPDLKISIRQVMDYIKDSEVHQLYRQKRKTKHIGGTLLKQPNKVIAGDLIDMTKNESLGYKWIFTTIDMFSRRSYVEPMKSKEARHIIPAFNKILSKLDLKPNKNKKYSITFTIPFICFHHLQLSF